MRDVAKRIEDEMVESAEERLGRLGNRAEICEVGGVAETKTEDVARAVHGGNGSEFDSQQRERTVYRVQIYAGQRTVGGRIVKDVRERFLQHTQRGFSGINRNRGFLFQVVGANVVEAEDMVGVRVGVKDRVEAVDAR